jgi:hypothetical protein
MMCLDCSTQQRESAAVGVCTTCGAGVCRAHLELHTHVITPNTGVGATRHYLTRAVTCAECAPVLTALHHKRYPAGFGSAATAGR